VLAGDLVVAGRSARLNSGYTRSGLTPDGGGTWLLPRIVGHQRAFEIMALNETISAEAAHALGLVTRIVEDGDLDAEVEGLLARLATMAPGVLGTLRRRDPALRRPSRCRGRADRPARRHTGDAGDPARFPRQGMTCLSITQRIV
jgi:enoyl-CoA hydratase/carnithine racemase